MFWWEKAALMARAFDPAKGKGTRRFGLITTNSLRQTFLRRVVEAHLSAPKKPLSLVFVVPDHPWVDVGEGAAVRIAMTVGAAGSHEGRLLTTVTEDPGEEAEGRIVNFREERGKVLSDLSIGADVAGSLALRANAGLAATGVKLHGSGFIVTPKEATALGIGSIPGLEKHIRPFLNGRDLVQSSRGSMVIDLFGLSEKEVSTRFPAVYQHVLDRVKPERDAKASQSPDSAQYACLWWLHGKPRPILRDALFGIKRFIASTRTAKHRIFSFVEESVCAESKIVCFALSYGDQLSILSSKLHLTWALSAGGALEDRPTYNHSDCFNRFPFPDLSEVREKNLRDLGEALDAHRKARQAEHPTLTLTQMYNVLEKRRAGRPLEGPEREIDTQGLVGILQKLHDDIDREVAAAYGWPDKMTDAEILSRLVALNRERAEEEAKGHVRWLRPDYQNPTGRRPEAKQDQHEIVLPEETETRGKPRLPSALPDQMTAVRATLAMLGEAGPSDVARCFQRGNPTRVQALLDTLAALGQARKLDGNRYAI